ncbi:hypothetical protein A9986_09715 [Solibacillus silvestris]|nr:DUF3006 domain-containing protein [Solibacillus silvestris]OBW57015.1 hypothetical protein A9986_09715 [Solibacillus silvestris]
MKYTLDRIENDLYVFVEKGNEGNQIEISKDFVPMGIVEGDIIEIKIDNGLYNFKQLNEEKKIQKNDVQSLIDKLKNK